jgi:hypothetical protein
MNQKLSQRFIKPMMALLTGLYNGPIRSLSGPIPSPNLIIG